MFTCPNPSCKKTFAAPLKTLNLQVDPTKPYNACPFCLTKLNETSIEVEAAPEEPCEKALTIQTNAENKARGNSDKPATCRYHLGYLSERAQKQQIPDDCLVCREIVQCMLAKMQAE